MANTENSITAAVSPQLRAAIDAYCRRNRANLSELIREAVAEKIGKPELAAMVKGRPRNDAVGSP